MDLFTIVILFVIIVIIAIYLGKNALSIIGGALISPFFVDIEKATDQNTDWRRVLHTSSNLQTVVMSVPIGQELGWEVHHDSDQLFRIESGTGQIMVNDTDPKGGFIGHKTWDVNASSLVVVPKGTYHNVINNGTDELKFYTVYSPPHHPVDTVDRTHADEINREKS